MSAELIQKDIKKKILAKHIKSKILVNDKENDKLIMILILMHWFAASTLMAMSYNTYIFGFINGGLLSLISFVFYKFYRGTILSRTIFGAVLVAFSAIFIQQHLGRIEIHFHIFVVIAFLTIYKDHYAALGATILTALHHTIGNILQENNTMLFDVHVYIFNYGCGFDIVLLHASFVVLEFAVVAYFTSLSRQRFIKILESEFKFMDLSASLEREVQDRTAQYQSAKEDAESANRAKSSFLANMSHEIRTPLNAILGFVQILQENETDKEKSKYIHTIKKSSDSLLDIINDILDFAKVESGKMAIDPISVNPHEDFDNIGSLFFAKAEDLRLKFHIYIDPYLPKRVIIDSLRIRQILTNLLSNAMKFSPENGVVLLEIKYDAQNQIISFRVQDNGIGIAPENHSKIFEAFSQEEDSTSRKYGGTGLGLAISAKLVNLMDSKLELDSKPGKGSEFSFNIKVDIPSQEEDSFSTIPNISNINVAMICPVDKEEYSNVLHEYLESFGMHNLTHLDSIEGVTVFTHPLLVINSNMYSLNQIQLLLGKGHAVIVIKSSLSQNFSNVFKGKVAVIDPPFTPSSIHDALLELFMERKEDNVKINTGDDFNKEANILIAEDNDSNQYLMSVIMKKLELKHTFADDGLEAVTMFKSGSFDLILMDENMPNMNGTQAAINILEIEKENGLLHTPIISLTANAIKGDRERFLEAGMDEYLSKPVDVDKLVIILKHFLPIEKNIEETTVQEEIRDSEKPSKEEIEMNEIVSAESLADKLGFDIEDVQALLNMFFNGLEEKIDELYRAEEAQDYQTMFTISHTIKGSSGNIGLNDIYNSSALIELNAREKNKYDYKAQIKILQGLIEETKKIKDRR